MRGDLDLAPELTKAGIEVFSLDLANPHALGRAALRLRRALKSFSPDIVHAHLFWSELAVFLDTFLSNAECARFVTFHNLGYDSHPVDSMWRRARRQLERLAVNGFEGSLAGGQAIADHYAQRLGLRTIVPVPYACEFSEQTDFSAELRARWLSTLGIEPSVPLITLPGTFKAEKGHRYLVDALATLRTRGVSVQAAFTSDGPLLSDIRARVVANGVADRVRFLGRLPAKSDVLRLMSLSDLVVLPSTHEGYPISAIEAMGLGAVVVASSVGGLTELIDHGTTGFLVEPENPSKLAGSIADLLPDAVRRREVGLAARRAVRARHDPATVALRHEELYREALDRKRQQRTRVQL